MAAALSVIQKKEDFKDEFLTCSICAEPYDNDKHKAKCLPCLHTYCKSCLESVAVIDCPNCRKQIKLPGETVDSLPHNFLVENRKEYQDIFNSSITCGSCSHQYAVGFCDDCDAFLCQKCEDAHAQLGLLSHHKLSTMAELQESKCNPKLKQQPQCKRHPKQDVTMYCRNPECKVPVCGTCAHLDHRGHDLIEMSAAIDEFTDDIRRSVVKVTGRRQELESKRSEFESKKLTLTTDFKENEKKLQESTEKLHKQIDAKYSQDHASLKTSYESDISNLNANIAKIDDLAVLMKSACEFANQACDMSQPTQLLISQNQIMERLNELKSIAIPESSSTQPIKKDRTTTAQIQKLPPVDPQRCTIMFGLPSEQFQHRKAIINTVDNDGQVMTKGGTRVIVSKNRRYLQVRNNNDGTYTSLTQENKHTPLHVQVNGVEIKDSPFYDQTEVDPSKCTIALATKYRIQIKHSSTCQTTLQLVDRNGNELFTNPPGHVEVDVSQQGWKNPITNKHDGTYSFKYVVFCHQNTSLQVLVNRQHIRGSPFTV